jgi:hypothetical protein
MLGSGVLGASSFKYYEILTNSFSAGLATTGLPATIATDSCMVSLSEDFTPWDRAGNEGFLGVCTATATSATTLTGMTSNVSGDGDATVFANEYRNFQIRIVKDTVNPTAVGQRARITSHTAGSSPVYTVPTWAVTPSANAQYVIENDNSKILLWSSATATTYTYNTTSNSWDTTTFGARGSAVGAGCTANQAYGISRDTTGNARHSYIFSTRGGNSAAIDILDIAGGANGVWTNDPGYGMKGTAFNTGTCSAYDPNSNGGRFIYFNQSGGQRHHRFDVLNRVIEPWKFMPYSQGTAAVAERLAIACFSDNYDDPNATKLTYLLSMRMANVEVFQVALQR